MNGNKTVEKLWESERIRVSCLVEIKAISLKIELHAICFG